MRFRDATSCRFTRYVDGGVRPLTWCGWASMSKHGYAIQAAASANPALEAPLTT
ncbi:MAG TPA: hypothetical protein VID75_11005 [Acidimicrobiales bacterium]